MCLRRPPEDLRKFEYHLGHPWSMLGTQRWTPSAQCIHTASPILNLIDLAFPALSPTSPTPVRRFLFYCRYLACFVSHPVCEVIINPMVMWHDAARVLKTDFQLCMCCALPLGWTTPGWEIYFILNKTHWLQRHWAKSHPFIPMKVD